MREIGIATSTYYPEDSLNIRARLALRTISAIKESGYPYSIVDGGSSECFLRATSDIGMELQPQRERGMSTGRQQAFRHLSIQGVDRILWVEPEKVSMITDCLSLLVTKRINADILIPKRMAEGLRTYPDYQTRSEQRGNRLINDILKSRGFLTEDEDFDWYFGPRVFANNSTLMDLFTTKYKYQGYGALSKIVNPDLWSNALFLPPIMALAMGFKIGSVPVPYCHPLEQMQSEIDDKQMERKRDIQIKNITISIINLIKGLEGKRNKLIRT